MHALIRKVAFGGVMVGAVAMAWAADGDLDTGFGIAGKAQTTYAGTSGENYGAAAVQADSSILAAGVLFTEDNNENVLENKLFIGSYSATGTLLSQRTVNNPAVAAENGAVSGNGEIVLVGGEDAGASARAKILKYSASGTLVNSFSYPTTVPTATSGAFCGGKPVFEASGKIVVPCLHLGADGVGKPALFKLNSNLTLDTTAFGGDGIAIGSALGNGTVASAAGYAESFAAVSDGAGGYYLLNVSVDAEEDDPPYTTRVYVQRILASGAVDTTFGGTGIAQLASVATTDNATRHGYDLNVIYRDSAGRVLVGLQKYTDSSTGGSAEAVLIRLTGSGAFDTSFGSSGTRTFSDQNGYAVRDLFEDSQNRLYMLTSSRLVRLLANGSSDASFNAPASDVNALNAPSPCSGPACYNSQWRQALVLADGKSAIAIGGVNNYAVEQGEATAENAILAKIKIDDAVDTTPDAFSFAAKTNVALGSLTESAAATITGITGAAPISVGGGGNSQYRIGAGAWTSSAGTVNNNEVVQLRHTSSANGNTAVSSTLNIGGVSATFTSTTQAADTTPDAFSFAAQGNVALNATLVSNSQTVSGINAPASIAIAGGTAAAYSIGCNGSFTAATGTITNGQTVCVRQTSAAAPNTATTTTLTIGGVAAVFQVTTGNGDTTPDAFSFAAKTNVATATLTTSDAVTITGIDTPATVSISGGGGQYQIGNGGWLSVPATISNGQAVRVRLTSSSAGSTTVTATLDIGGVTAPFTVTTSASDTTPDAFAFAAKVDVDPGAPVASDAIAVSGINAATPISVSGGSYSIGAGAFVTGAGTVTSGQTVRVQHTAASQSKTATSTTLTIGGVSAVFTSTTKADTTPDAFSFASQNDVAVSSSRTSTAIIVSGIDEAVPIAVVGGQYSVSCAANGFTASAGTISNTQSVCVRHTASSQFATTVTTTLTIGGVSGTFSSKTEAQDTTPDAYSFVNQTAVAKGIAIISAPITIAGINSAAPISVSGGSYSIDGAAFTTSTGTISNGQSVRVQHTSAANDATAVDTTLTVGGVSRTFRSTTGDGTPNAFAFTAQNGVASGSTVTSAPVTIAGLTIAAPISVVNGSYSINSETAFTTAAGTVGNGDVVRLRHVAAAGFSAPVTTTLSIGGVSGAFTSTTLAADTVPDAFSFVNQPAVSRGSEITSAAVTISGVNTAVPISVSGGSYSIDGGAFTTANGSIGNGQSVRVRHAAATGFAIATGTTLTMGGVAATFTSTTESQDLTPTAFSLAEQTGVAPAAVVTSVPVTIGGINDATTISVSGGSYSIDGAAFTVSPGTVTQGQVVRVQVTAAAAEGSSVTATLTIGGVSAPFKVTTLSADSGSSGGAAGAWLLLPFAGLAWLRRRAQRLHSPQA